MNNFQFSSYGHYDLPPGYDLADPYRKGHARLHCGANLQIVQDGHKYHPMHSNGSAWEYYYSESRQGYGFVNLERITFYSKDDAIDFLTGEVLKSYNDAEKVVWP